MGPERLQRRLLARGGRRRAATDAAGAALEADGTCWLGATRWRGRAAVRISISSWATTADDVERSAEAIRAAARAATALATGA